MDQDDKIVLIVALVVLALVALVAFFLILCDPVLFRTNDDDDDDESEEKMYLPKWTVEYVDHETTIQQHREYERQYAAYLKEKEAYERKQQQQQQAELKKQPTQQQVVTVATRYKKKPQEKETDEEEVDIFNKTQTKAFGPTEIEGRDKSQSRSSTESLPHRMQSSVSDTPEHTLGDKTTENYSLKNRQLVSHAPIDPLSSLEERGETEDALVPFDEADDGRKWKPEPKANVELADNFSGQDDSHQPEEKNNLSTSSENIQGDEWSVHRDNVDDAIGETKKHEINDSMSAEADYPVSSLPVKGDTKDTKVPPEAAPSRELTENQIKHSPSPSPPPPPPPPPLQQQQRPAIVRVHSLGSMIPRYSHKQERQRFIILNALILFIVARISTVLIIQFYV